jgi:hypothetical protein
MKRVVDNTGTKLVLLAAAIAIVVGWLLRKRTGRPITAGIIFFPAMLFPMLGFFSLYTFVYTFVADHYQYLACIGPIAIAAGIAAARNTAPGNPQ